MANTREIVTKAVIGKGKKTFVTTDVVTPEIVPTTILGAWVINHNFSGSKNLDKVIITGSYDVNIWYSCMDDSKTEVVKKNIRYQEVVTVPKKSEKALSNEEVVIRSLKQPTVTNVQVQNGNIVLDIEKELGVEIVGDTKIKVPVEDMDDDYEEILDESEMNDIDSITDDYLDKDETTNS